nr:MAG TPA: hypothetical protein [Crassvirales sp.]
MTIVSIITRLITFYSISLKSISLQNHYLNPD